jgi:signal transduction histidine kinase/ActR/RegA family two-component response regulator
MDNSVASTTAPLSYVSSPDDNALSRSPQRLLALVARLSQPERRREAARLLAVELGADDLIIFVRDDELNTLLPAPGFLQTLPDGQRWHAFLAGCGSAVAQHGELPYPDAGTLCPVVALGEDGGTLLLLLGGHPRMDSVNEIAVLLPLLAAAFRGEWIASIARSSVRVASHAASEARVLAASLDKARAALRKAFSDAEMANRAKDRFLAALSHELRTPLTPVLLASAAAEADPQIPDAIRREMAMIRRSVELEVHLIDDLLDLSRVIAGKLRLRCVSLDINTEVRHAVEMCLPYIREKGVKLTLDLMEPPASVLADPTRFQQVLWNLLKNAVKFSAGGEIFVSTGPGLGGGAKVSVRDTGIGIEPAALERIFDAFEQGSAETPREFGGLGLGLAISKAIMDLHGGSIRAESEGLGHGATFTVEVRVSEAVAPESSHGTRTAQPSKERHARILIVEDHDDTARLLARLLTKSGHQVKTAGRVAEGLEILAAEEFDLLLSDVGLPDRPGYDLMQEAADRYHLPGIAMTGYAMEEDVRKCREAGFSEHLVKPVNIQQLQQVIQRILAQRASGDA